MDHDWKQFKGLALYDRLSLLVFIGMAVVIALSFRDYGLAWDEPFHEHYGTLIIDYIASGGADQRVNTFRNLNTYGGLFDGIAALLAMVSPMEPFHTRHLFNAVIGLLGVAGVWTMARAMGGGAAGFWAMAALLAIPTYSGHIFINPKDIPFAVGTLWTLHFAMRTASLLPHFNARAAIGLGLALGATLGVRIGGIVLILYLVTLVALHLAWAQGRQDTPTTFAAALQSLTKTTLVVAAISFILTFVLWPSAWPFMIDKAIETALLTGKFKFSVDVLFQGEVVNSLALPLTYVPGYLAVKLPEIVLILFVLSVPLGAWRLMNALCRADRTLVFGYTTLALGIFFPILFAMAVRSAHYDALRHFIFVLPPMAVLIGVELSAILNWLHQNRSTLSSAVGLAVVAGLMMPMLAMVQLHPYAYTYYNRFADGIEGAQGRYELDYWATSYRAAAEWLRTANEVPATGDVPVYVCGPTDSVARFLPERFKIVKEIDQAQFFIAFTRWNCDALIEAPTLHAIERNGVKFTAIKDLRGAYTVLGKMPNTVEINKDYPRYGKN